MIMEPFSLKGFGNEAYWETFDKEVRMRAQMAKKIAEKYNLPFIPLQEGFDDLAEKADASYWLGDGVHPTAMGHEFIKNEWMKAFKAL
jgi:lysophospholipase L1-like esterase